MKITITVNCKHQSKLVLFGARYHHLAVNFGNPTTTELKKLEFHDDYKEEIGVIELEHDYFNFSAFLMDCIKYDLRVISINGEPLKRKIKGSYPIKYEEVEELNPYLEMYECELPTLGEYKFVIELIKCDSDKIQKSNRKLLFKN